MRTERQTLMATNTIFSSVIAVHLLHVRPGTEQMDFWQFQKAFLPISRAMEERTMMGTWTLSPRRGRGDLGSSPHSSAPVMQGALHLTFTLTQPGAALSQFTPGLVGIPQLGKHCVWRSEESREE